jgi:hypothetical protein
LLCGGRFRTFFIAIAVSTPFLIALPWFLRVQFAMPDYPMKGFVEYFLYFVAAPILLVWMVTHCSIARNDTPDPARHPTSLLSLSFSKP